MSHDGKSRLSRSLLGANEAHQKPPKGENGKPESEQTESRTEAFEQADSQVTATVSKIKPPNNEVEEKVPETSDIGDITLELDEALIIEDRKEEIKPEKVKKRNIKNSKSVASLLAVILSVAAIGSVGYIGFKVDKVETLFSQKTLSQDEKVEGLISQSETFSTQMGQVKEIQAVHVANIEAVLATNEGVATLKQQFFLLAGEVQEIRQALDNHSKMIAGQTKDIGSLQTHVKQIKLQQLRAKRVAKPKSTLVNKSVKKPQPQDPTKLEGSTVSSIDVWGKRIYVMLKEPRGSNSVWVPLTIGDRYKGWTLKSAEGTRVVFTNDGKTRNLEIRD